MSQQVSFDLKRVKELFQECFDNELDMNYYCDMYQELNRLFTTFGRLFSVVTKEINEKTNILRQYLDLDSDTHNAISYQQVETMLDYELSNELVWLDPKKSPCHLNSGSRTFLRLHRALDFVLLIIEGIRTSNENDAMAPLVWKAYDKSLAKFHPWLVRQGVHLAVYTLPNRKKVVLDMARMQSEEEANQLMYDTVSIGRQVYDACETALSNRDMLNLP